MLDTTDKCSGKNGGQRYLRRSTANHKDHGQVSVKITSYPLSQQEIFFSPKGKPDVELHVQNLIFHIKTQ